jgi:hypothetical protein
MSSDYFQVLSPIGGHGPSLQKRLLQLRRGLFVTLKLEYHPADMFVVLVRLEKT